MKRRTFLKNSAVLAGTAAITIPVMGNVNAQPAEKSLFEWRIYHISRKPNAKGLLEKYFREALIPFLNQRQIGFSAFNEYALSEPVKLYVLIAYPNRTAYFKAQDEMLTDAAFLQAAKSYNSIPAASAVYDRFETYFLDAFDGFPAFKATDQTKQLFELRLYESASEDAGKRKIEMFNKEEIACFLKVGIIPVFFGKIIAGQYMPALLYMVGFKDMAERDAAWGRFSEDPDWKTMRDKVEYADTVSNIHRLFLTPAKI